MEYYGVCLRSCCQWTESQGISWKSYASRRRIVSVLRGGVFSLPCTKDDHTVKNMGRGAERNGIHSQHSNIREVLEDRHFFRIGLSRDGPDDSILSQLSYLLFEAAEK